MKNDLFLAHLNLVNTFVSYTCYALIPFHVRQPPTDLLYIETASMSHEMLAVQHKEAI